MRCPGAASSGSFGNHRTAGLIIHELVFNFSDEPSFGDEHVAGFDDEDKLQTSTKDRFFRKPLERSQMHTNNIDNNFLPHPSFSFGGASSSLIAAP